jgi:hypothetical protein
MRAIPPPSPRRAVASSLGRVGLVVGALAIAAGACASSASTTIATPDSTGFIPKGSALPPSTEPASEPAGTTAPAGAGTSTTALGKPTLTDSSTISTVGLDKVHFGMTVADAEAAAGAHLVADGTKGDCYLAKPDAGAAGVAFLISDGRVERVDITGGNVATRSGIKVGSTNSSVKAAYPGQIQDAPRPDGQPGGALVFVPKDAADAQFRIVFLTDGTTVQAYRAGRLPQVTAASGCK